MRRLPIALCALGTLVAIGASIAGAGATSKAFTSRYHYAMTVPTGWTITPATKNLAPTRFPDPYGAETDSLVGPPGPQHPRIYVAAVNLRAGTTLQTWKLIATKAIADQYGCVDPAQGASGTLAGEPTKLLIYSNCNNYYFVELATVHHGRGYHVVWVSPTTSSVSLQAKDRAGFNRILKTFRFTN